MDQNRLRSDGVKSEEVTETYPFGEQVAGMSEERSRYRNYTPRGLEQSFSIGEAVIIPVHWDSVWHNATIVEWEPWANEKQKQKYVRVLTDEGTKESVLRLEVVRPAIPHEATQSS